MITVITVMGAPGSKSSLAAGHHRGMLHGLRPTSPGAAGSVGAPAVSRVRTAWPESSPEAAGRASQAVPLRALDTSSATQIPDLLAIRHSERSRLRRSSRPLASFVTNRAIPQLTAKALTKAVKQPLRARDAIVSQAGSGKLPLTRAVDTA